MRRFVILVTMLSAAPLLAGYDMFQPRRGDNHEKERLKKQNEQLRKQLSEARKQLQKLRGEVGKLQRQLQSFQRQAGRGPQQKRPQLKRPPRKPQPKKPAPQKKRLVRKQPARRAPEWLKGRDGQRLREMLRRRMMQRGGRGRTPRRGMFRRPGWLRGRDGNLRGMHRRRMMLRRLGALRKLFQRHREGLRGGLLERLRHRRSGRRGPTLRRRPQRLKKAPPFKGQPRLLRRHGGPGAQGGPREMLKKALLERLKKMAPRRRHGVKDKGVWF